MAKKGNMNISNDDFNFGDELFPLDDSVYDDDDLAGFKFDANDEGPGGVKGFFKNTLKSIKGIGLDFADEFLPEVTSLTDELRSAASDTKDAFLEKKDKLVQGFADFKSSIGKRSVEESKKAVKDGFSKVLGDIKKGKFYTSNRDAPIDMDAMFGDDDDYAGDSQDEDTSGKMTTKFNYKAPRSKRINNIFVSNNNNAAAMAEIQETATMTTASINTRLAKAQIRNSNQNFYETLNVLKNIDDNLYGLSKFLTHYGKTNIDAQLEFDSKTLAFLTDQRALLKDILVANNRAIGIKSEEELKEIAEREKERDSKRLLSFGSFDMSKYLKNIGGNAKEMFAGTQLGSMVEMITGMTGSGMFGKGGMMKPGQLLSQMAKSFAFNNLIGSDTKNKLDRMNDLFGNIGGSLIAGANKWKDSNNPVFSFLGQLLGTDKGINRSIDLNTEDLNAQTVFDVKTKETINETIPGYLAQITAALTGGKLTYYNHATKQFEERDSIKKKYEQAQENAINTNIKFTSGMNFISEGLIQNNGKGSKALDENSLMKGMDKFKKNLIDSKSALDIYSLTHNNKEYTDKLFRGFKSIDPNNEEQLKNAIISQLTTLSPAQVADINNSIFRVATEVEDSARNFKLEAIKNGGLTAIAEINDAEKWAEIDYDKRYSAQYNEDLAGSNEFAKRRARLNTLKADQSMFMERVGKINLSDTTRLSDTSSARMGDIYRLLLNGIKVYPSNDPKGLQALKDMGASFSSKEIEKAKREKDEEEKYDKLRIESAKAKIEEEKINYYNKNQYRFKGAKDESLMGQVRELLGVDRLVAGVTNILSKPLETIYGVEATNSLINDGAFDKESLEETKAYYEQTKAAQKDLLKQGTAAIKQQAKSNKKAKGFDKVIGFFDSTKARISKDLSGAESALRTHNAKAAVERAKKEAKKAQDIAKNGTLAQRTFGFEFVSEFNNMIMEMNSSAKSKVYIDPEFLDSVSDKNKVTLYNILNNNAAIITTSTYDDDIDVAFYKKLESEDKSKFEKDGVYLIKATAKNLPILNKYLSSSGFARSVLSRNQRKSAMESGDSVSFNIDQKEKQTRSNKDIKRNIANAQKAYNEFNKANNKNSAEYQKLSKSKQNEIEKQRQELLNNLKKAEGERVADKALVNSTVYKYKYLSKINSAKSAGEFFLKKETETEINELLSSNNELAILNFANRIKSKNERVIGEKEHLSYLDPEFRARLSDFLNDPELLGKGVTIKESVRSPLFHFALYSKGRCNPSITDQLLKAAGHGEGINYFPSAIREVSGPDGITVRSLASNHLTGRAVDLNNGSISYEKLGKLASQYAIKWAGKDDKPHFEFDPKAKYSGKKKAIRKRKNTATVSTDNTGKTDAKINTSGTVNKRSVKMTVSGTPVSLYQNDPVDTTVTGTPTLGKDASIKEFIMSIDKNVNRIANNTEKIGFGIGIPGTIGKGLFGKVGDTLGKFAKGAWDLSSKALKGIKGFAGKTFDGAKDFLFGDGEDSKGLIGKAFDTGKNILGGIRDNFGSLKNKLSKMSVEEMIAKYGLDKKLGMTVKQIKKKFNRKQIIKMILDFKKKNSIFTKGKEFLFGNDDEDGFFKKGKDFASDIFSKGKNFIFGNDDEDGILKKGMSAAKSMFDTGKDTVSGLFKQGKDFLFGKASDAYGQAVEFLKDKLNLSDEEIENMSKKEILELAYKNGFEAIKGRVGGVLGAAKKFGSNVLGAIGGFGGGGLGFGGGNKIINKMDEIIDAIYDVNGKPRPAKFSSSSTSTESVGFMDRLKNSIKSKFKRDKDVEGSYADQQDDKVEAEKKERDDTMAKNIASIAAVMGTGSSIAAAAKESAKPEPTIASLLMSNYQNSEKQNQLLEGIEAKSGTGGSGGFLSNLGSAGAKISNGIKVAGGVATIGAAAAGAAMIGKQISNRVKATKIDSKNSTFGEKLSGIFGGGGSGNYDNNGNRINDKDVKAGKGFGLNQLVHMGTFAKGVSKLPAIFGKFSKLVEKIFQNPKIIAKIGGKQAAQKVASGFLTTMTKTVTKGGAKIIEKVSTKIASFCAKVSQPIGWAVMVAQLVYDIGSGMAEANRYFKMGKGMKPTWAMRITAGLAKAISGNLTFGLIPPEAIANMVFKLIGKDSTKQQMAEAEKFDKERAAILEVEYGRLVEFETMTWSERLFGGTKKRATILGFMKGKHDVNGKERFEAWFEKVYKPLDDMYTSMVKAYGGKVDKVVKSDDVAALENRDQFRKDYLESAKKYMSTNNLYGLGPLGKAIEDEKEKKEESEAEAEMKVSKFSKAVLESEGIDVSPTSQGVVGVSSAAKSAVAENAQADGINYGKINDSSYAQNWQKNAEKNAKDSSAADNQVAAKSGFKKGLAGAVGKIANSKAFKAIRSTVGKVGNWLGKHTLIGKAIKGARDAIAMFVSNRKASEAEVSTMLNDPNGTDILKLQDKIVDKGALGQQTSSANLSPEFAQRVEAFLKDPRVANHGVRIREGFRSPATQLAYFSKGRTLSSITDKLMKKAGFKEGINFWNKSFQKPGDYITWTLASNHFNGTAVDLEPGDLGYDKLGAIATEYGIDWGGNWSTPDKPHFEMGDPNFSLANAGSSGSDSIAEMAQADTFNYDKMLSNANVRKAANLTKAIVNKSKSYISSNINNNISSIRTMGSKIASGTKTAFNKVKSVGNSIAERTGTLTSNLIVSKFDDLLTITTQGVDIMQELLSETKRHNEKEEKMLENLIKGIAGLGAIMASVNNGGYSSAGADSSITKGVFDILAKGL